MKQQLDFKSRPGVYSRLCLWLALALLFVAVSPASAHAQKCNKLFPAGNGQDDSARINECLQNEGRAKLKKGTFLLYSPIVFPRTSKSGNDVVSGVRLIGKNRDKTRLVVQSDCGAHWPFEEGSSPGLYQPVIQAVRSPGAIIKNFELDLSNLRKDCGYMGSYVVTLNKSPGSNVTNLGIFGSQYGGVSYTTGGANSGGISVVLSPGSLVSGNIMRDIGFAKENGGTSAGSSGLAVINSGNTIVEDNEITRVAFGIIISNTDLSGDSSGTVVKGNHIIGAAGVSCPDCSQGRAIKLQACGPGGEPPLENIVVRDNTATDFGGPHGVQDGSGLDLVCGVRYSIFENNKLIGAPTAEFGLQIRSSYAGTSVNTTHHNIFNFNTFASGRGRLGCNLECSDVNFTGDGPDQIGIQRNGQDRAGSNTFSSLRTANDRGCNEYSHAFVVYLSGKNFVRQGENILLAASGVRPSRRVRFRFVRTEDGITVSEYSSQPAQSNCVLNQEEYLIEPDLFTPGSYQVFADYDDGNTDAVISDDPIAVITVKQGK